MRVEVSVFELPRLLGIPQHVEFEPPPKEWCAPDYCPHSGVLIATGCKRGICIKYRVWVYSSDGRRWSAKERWRRRREETSGGCVNQLVADALWELAERGFSIEIDSECGIVVNGVRVGRISCRSVDRCIEEILRAYEHAKNVQPRPRRDPAEEEYEELLRQYPLLRWWNKTAIIEALRRGEAYRWGLYNLLSRLAKVDMKVWALLAHFDLDFRCSVDVYATDGGELCVRFHVDNCRPLTYCYSTDSGWRAVSDTPKFTRYRPTEDGRLVEVYTIENKEYVRVA
jgi:hypothetical protein